MTAKIPEEGVEKFNEYESHVLPLLSEHGAKLERRLQSLDLLNEVHIIWFPSSQSFENYRKDPRRSQHTVLEDNPERLFFLEGAGQRYFIVIRTM